MASKKIQCNWCQKEKEQVVNSFFAACPIIPEMEEKIPPQGGLMSRGAANGV